MCTRQWQSGIVQSCLHSQTERQISTSGTRMQRRWLTNTIKYLKEKNSEAESYMRGGLTCSEDQQSFRATFSHVTKWTTRYIQVWRHAGRLAPARVLHVERQTDVGMHAWWWQDTTGADVWTGQKMDGWMDGREWRDTDEGRDGRMWGELRGRLVWKETECR